MAAYYLSALIALVGEPCREQLASMRGFYELIDKRIQSFLAYSEEDHALFAVLQQLHTRLEMSIHIRM